MYSTVYKVDIDEDLLTDAGEKGTICLEDRCKLILKCISNILMSGKEEYCLLYI